MDAAIRTSFQTASGIQQHFRHRPIASSSGDHGKTRRGPRGPTSVYLRRADSFRGYESIVDTSGREIQKVEEVSGLSLRINITLEIEQDVSRALHAHLQPKSVAGYQPVFMRTARQHILDICENPNRHQDHAKR